MSAAGDGEISYRSATFLSGVMMNPNRFNSVSNDKEIKNEMKTILSVSLFSLCTRRRECVGWWKV
jgi:hypothetical protein